MKRSELNFFIDAVAFLGLILLVSTGLIMRFVLPPVYGGRSGGEGPSMLWGWDRHQWGDFHFWISAVLLIVMVVHLFLHWKWIVSVIKGTPREGSGIRVSLGILSLIVLLVVASSPFFSPTEPKPRKGKHALLEKGRHKPSEEKLPEVVNPSEPHKTIDENEGPVGEENSPVPKTLDISNESRPEKIVTQEKLVPNKETSETNIRGSMTLKELQEITGVPIAVILKSLGLPEDTDPESRLGRLRRQYGFRMSDVREVVRNHQP